MPFSSSNPLTHDCKGPGRKINRKSEEALAALMGALAVNAAPAAAATTLLRRVGGIRGWRTAKGGQWGAPRRRAGGSSGASE